MGLLHYNSDNDTHLVVPSRLNHFIIFATTVGFLIGLHIQHPISSKSMSVAYVNKMVKNSHEACLENMPEWVKDPTPKRFQSDMNEFSRGKTDKSQKHEFHHFYHRYLSPIARSVCDNQNQPSNKIRILEIGLGCSHAGGGSALAWRNMFPASTFDLDLHFMEIDKVCANSFSFFHKEIATVHVGDASNVADLHRVIEESGNLPFHVIIDDSSKRNKQQIITLETLIDHVTPGGIYVTESIHSSCINFKTSAGLLSGGTKSCLETKSGEQTIFDVLVEAQKKLVMNEEPYQGVNHVDICKQAAVLQKQIV